MKNIDYAQMSDQKLKQYLLTHKDDKNAFYFYLDRRHQQPKETILSVNEIETLETDEQIKLITKRLQQKFSP